MYNSSDTGEGKERDWDYFVVKGTLKVGLY